MSDQNKSIATTFRVVVVSERLRQLEKWGPQTHTPAEWMAILTEEVGEAAQATCQSWTDGKKLTAMLKELVQVAAVAEAAYVDIRDQMLPRLIAALENGEDIAALHALTDVLAD